MQLHPLNAERLGYRYLWQTDDDSRLLQPMGFDLAAHMRRRGLVMASKRTQHDPLSVTTGGYVESFTGLIGRGKVGFNIWLFKSCPRPSSARSTTRSPSPQVATKGLVSYNSRLPTTSKRTQLERVECLCIVSPPHVAPASCAGTQAPQLSCIMPLMLHLNTA